MKLKSLIYLIIAIILGGLLYYFGAKPEAELAESNSYLIPSLSEKLNDVTKLTIHEAGNNILAVVSKAENTWVVENRDGYQADFTLVRSLFTNLAEAKLIEAKTSNPDNYSRLGVEDIEQEKAQGVQFSIEGLGEQVNIIAGNAGTIGKNSQYIRRVGENQSWLINKKLNLKQDVTRWLKKDILDIPPERVKSIQIKHTDGSVITIENKGTEDYEFALLNELPEGKIISESEVYQVANALSSLQLVDVASLDKIDQEAAQPIITKYFTYDGLTLTAKSFPVKDQMYSIFDIEFNAENVDDNSTSVKNETNSAVNSDPEAAQELEQQVSPKLKGWAFVLPTITKDALIKKLENFYLDEDAS